MASCPNCGRRTLRTRDWVCQWCGYPLLSGGYKPIDKTFKELQEERNSTWRSVKPEPEPEFKFEPGPGPEPEPPKKQEPPPRRAFQAVPESKPEPEPGPVPPVAPEVPPPPPGPAAQSGPEALLQSPPEPVLLPKTEPPPQLETPPEAPPRPEPPPAPPPEPLTLPSLSSIANGTQLTIDQIDALFRSDSIGANAAFRDKTLLVRGLVNKIFIRDHIDVRYLILTGTGKVIWSARCSFEKESVAEMSRLNEGQEITLRGKYDGYSKNIIFKECTLVV